MFQTFLANISVNIKLWIQVFWVISVQFDLRNTLPKSGPFLLLHPVNLLTAIGQPPGGSRTVHIYTQTIHRTTQNKQHIEQHKNFEDCVIKLRIRRRPRANEIYIYFNNAESGNLYEDLQTFYCCRRHKFATNVLLCKTQHFYIVYSDNDTLNALLCFHCNNGYAVAP